MEKEQVRYHPRLLLAWWIVLILVVIGGVMIAILFLTPKPLVVKGALKTKDGPVMAGAYDFRLKFYDATTRTDLVYSYDAKGVVVDDKGNFNATLPSGKTLQVATLMQVCIASTESATPGTVTGGKTTLPSCDVPQAANTLRTAAFNQTICGLTAVDQNPTNTFSWLATRNVVYASPTKACGQADGVVASVSDEDVVAPLIENPGTLGEVLGSGVSLQPGTVLTVGPDGQLAATSPAEVVGEVVREEIAQQTTEEPAPVAGSDSQVLSLSGNVLSISGGNSVTLPVSSDGDSEIGNEIVDAVSGGGLVRVGAGTTLNPYKIQLEACANGEILKSSGAGAWGCATDAGGTSYTAGSGLQLIGAQFSINSPTCAGTTKLQWNGSAFVCSTDVDTNTTYSAGTGLSLSGTTFNNTGVLGVTASGAVTSSGGQNPNIAFANGSATGQFWQWDGDSWELATLAAEQDGVIGNEVTNVTGAASGLTRSGAGTAVSPYTLAANVGNGIQIASNAVTINSPTCAGTTKLQWNGTAFVCSADVDTDTDAQTLSWVDGTRTLSISGGNSVVIPDANTTYSTITNGGLRLVGTQFGLMVCSNGQIVKAQATSGEWACAADNDTIYGAGTGLSLVGTTFSNTGVLSVTASGAITSSGGQNPNIAFANGSAIGQYWRWDGDSWELASLPAESDGVIGNEVTNVTGINSGLARSGAGTALDPYTLAVSVGNGLQLSSGSVAINSPTCSGTTKLQWSGSAFVCSADVDTDTDTTDFSITDGTTSQTVNAAQAVTFTGSSATKLSVVLGGTRQLTFSLDTTGASTGQALTFTGSGLAWQAPTPASCSVSGTYICQGGNSGAVTIGSNDAQSLIFETSNTTQMTILSNGNVGIGTSPGEKLDVNGNINIPSTSSTVGVIKQNGSRFIHSAAGATNFFAGINAGNLTLTGTSNTAVGNQVLTADTSGDNNTGVGANALLGNTTGSVNSAVGIQALLSNTTGTYNSAIGANALRLNTTGTLNVAAGYGALDGNNGSSNTALGVQSLFSNTTGTLNAALGLQAGYTNTAANANTTGSNNTFIGSYSGPGSTTQRNNATAIGAFATVNQSDSLVLGCVSGVNGCTASTNVGIRAAAPQQELEVDGDIRLDSTGTGTAFGLCHTGANSTGTFVDRDIVACSGAPSDAAEWYETEPGVEAGDLVMTTDKLFTYEEELFDPVTGPTGRKASHSISVLSKGKKGQTGRILGVISTSPYQVFGESVKEAPHVKNPKPLALAGRVPLKVTTENGPIKVGDPLAPASTPGHAMKATSPGMIVGYALESLNDLSGKIDVFISTDYYGDMQTQLDDLKKGLLTGGIVTQDTTFKASAIFEGPARFAGSATFAGDVTITGKVKLSGDQVNQAVLSAGSRRIAITFGGAYPRAPYITATPREFMAGQFRVTKVTTTGFVIEVQQTQAKDIHFDWHAFAK